MQELKNNFNDEEKIYSELCFCITTANNKATTGLLVQEKIVPRIHSLTEKQIANELKNLGSRFHNNKAKYLYQAKKYKNIEHSLKNFENEFQAREWIVENIKGLGYKEASHFIRNIGYQNLAILDRHVLNLMKEFKLIKEKPKTLTKNKYLELEEKLKLLAKEVKMTQSELDFYLWYMKTGKILK
ncbi:N-glycosylase/DNA lyase [uncultured archaeon]|nr:N-glycosylase/DNA lyase [uncultured archaeon]